MAKGIYLKEEVGFKPVKPAEKKAVKKTTAKPVKATKKK